MKILAIDSATAASSIALAEDERIVATAARVDRRAHGEFLVPALDFCFDQAGWNPSNIDAIVVDVGPGLYTGIRVGLATAQGLAAAVGARLVPASSLDALALRAATGRRHIWSVVDVRRGQFAVASYRPVPGGAVKDGPPELVTPEQLRAMIESDRSDVLVVGDVPALPDGTLQGLHRVKIGRPRYPSADVVAELGRRSAEKDAGPHPEEIRPIYMREPDVQINWSVLRKDRGPWGEAP